MIEITDEDKSLQRKKGFGPIWPTIEEDMAAYAKEIQSALELALEMRSAEDAN
ncbi:MAG: hypothetical protein FWG41_03465 [Methanomassiliicoccaceae archaeon]|nr:hypothetical protein [Methanomassiliicoccaceae archaeon]